MASDKERLVLEAALAWRAAWDKEVEATFVGSDRRAAIDFVRTREMKLFQAVGELQDERAAMKHSPDGERRE